MFQGTESVQHGEKLPRRCWQATSSCWIRRMGDNWTLQREQSTYTKKTCGRPEKYARPAIPEMVLKPTCNTLKKMTYYNQQLCRALRNSSIFMGYDITIVINVSKLSL